MSLYLDASVIVPSMVEEEATAAVDRVLSAPPEPLLVSELAAVEVASALSRLVRMNIVTHEAANLRLGEFDSWRSTDKAEIDLHPADFRLASLFVRRFELALRAPDALHLAACRRGGHRLFTLDRRLAAAAETLGVSVQRLP